MSWHSFVQPGKKQIRWSTGNEQQKDEHLKDIPTPPHPAQTDSSFCFSACTAMASKPNQQKKLGSFPV